MKQLFTTLMLMICLSVYAETTLIPDMRFRRLDTRDGLSNSQINYIFQDSKGFVWIGTSYGLNRYDGYRFRTFYSNANDTTTLRNNYIDWIWEDTAGRLWLKQGMNYSIFDPVTERVVRNPSRVLSRYGITGGIDRIHLDSRKNIWVKTYDEGLYCYNPKTKKKILVKYGYGKEDFPREFYVSSFSEHNGRLLLASSDGDVMAIDGAAGKVVWKDSYIRTHGGRMSDAYIIKVDNQGNYWVLTSGRAFVYEPATGRWYDSINSFLETRGIQTLPQNLQVWDVSIDQRGWLWVATDHEGIIVVDLKNKEVRQFLNNKLDETSLSENTAKRLMLDKAGNMWIGLYRNGLNQYIENQSGFKSLELGDVNTTVEDLQGNYWLGTDNRGIIKYNPLTGETQTYDKANNGLASDIMVASCRAKDGSVWFGTYNGGLVRVGPDGQVTNYLATGAADGLSNNNVWSVTEDKWGNIWIGTLGNGVQRLNPRTGKFRSWTSHNTKLKENFMTSVAWTRKGWLMAAHSQYYSLIHPLNGKVVNITIPDIPGQPAAMASTICAVEDSRGLVWHGSTAGCCIIDGKTGRQTLLDMNTGLLGSSVLGIVEDLRHTMWVVTEHGVSNITPQQDDEGNWSFTVHSFSTRDGLQYGPYNQRSVSCTRDGKILVGGLGGIDIIDPQLITNVGNKETPVFSGLKLFDQQVAVGHRYDGRVVLEKALNEVGELVLRYSENQFTIQLATDKGEMRNPSRFVYQLEGFSDKWLKTEEVNPNITYMSLEDGSYTLRVRMLNDDGTMGQVESVLHITIAAPWWRNDWMLLLYVALIAGAGWLLRRRVKRNHARQMEQERERWETNGCAETDEAAGAADEADGEGPVSGRQDSDLVQLMHQVCDGFRPEGDKRIRLLYFPLVDQLDMPIDRERFGQGIKVLLDWVAGLSPNDGKVKVFLDRTGGKAVIRISDSGAALTDDALARLFEATDGEPGNGLHEAAGMVAAHHGSIRAEHNPGGGTLIIVELPVDGREPEVEEAVLMDEE